MPFYLVVQTSLVEADDERSAAQKSVDQLRTGGHVSVQVKSDETTVKQIVVAQVDPTQSPTDATQVEAEPKQSSAVPPAPMVPIRKAILKRIATDALALVTRQP